MTKKSDWRAWLYRVGVAAGGALLLYQVVQAIATLVNDPVHFQQWWLVGAAGLMIFLALSVQIAAWALIMKSLGVRLPIRVWIRSYSVPLLARYVPGTVWGYWGRGEWLRRHLAVPHSISAAGSILEMASLLTAAASIVIAFGALTLDSAWRNAGLAGALALPIAVWGLTQLVRGQNPIRRLPFIAVTLESIGRPAVWQWVTWILMHGVLWLCYGLAIDLILHALLPGQGWRPLSSTALFALAWLAGFAVVFVPTGMGVREIALAGLLASQLNAGAGVANIVAVTSRLTILMVELAFVAIGSLGPADVRPAPLPSQPGDQP